MVVVLLLLGLLMLVLNLLTALVWLVVLPHSRLARFLGDAFVATMVVGWFSLAAALILQGLSV